MRSLWKILGASVRGASHEKNGLPCQDAHRWVTLPHGILIAAVADGAGSAPLGDIGADIATQTAIEFIVRQMPILPDYDEDLKNLLSQALKSARKAIQLEASIYEVNDRDLATTLILVFATPEYVIAGQIGDGAVVIKGKQGKITGLTSPQTGEYINQTTFLISPNAINTAQLTVWREPVANIGIISDGLQMIALKMPEGTPHIPFFSPLFRFVSNMNSEAGAKAQLEAFLRSSRVRQRTDDDLTILLAAMVDRK